MKKVYLAFDLGASSGRLMMGYRQGEALQMEEIHRFANGPVSMGQRLYWDVPYLLQQMKEGLKKISRLPVEAVCIGIDTWGVDYGYIGADGSLLGLPFCYRDPKNQEAMEEWNVNFGDIYAIAGLQKIALNTAFQLYYDITRRPQLLRAAKHLLWMPDLLAYFLTGEVSCEYTIASTSMLLDAGKRDWSPDILAELEKQFSDGPAPSLRALLPEIRRPGQVLGTLTPAVQEETGLSAIPVAVVASHDTASAVAGTPFESQTHAFLSSGTWSLLGLETENPWTGESSYQADFTNEGGADGKTLYLKNISGLWVVQQLRKEWHMEYPAMIQLARQAIGGEFRIDPEDASFVAPSSMEEAIRAYCAAHYGKEPQTRGQILAAVYQGLTETYRGCLDAMRAITGCQPDTLHMVGGGIQDTLLCQLTAQVTGVPVVTGPVEAAALGNILLQMVALGELGSLQQGRDMVRRSTKLERYEP